MAPGNIDRIRRGAVGMMVAAAVTVVAGAVLQFGLQPNTDISDDMWRYPWSSGGAFVAFSVLSATMHGLVAYGVLAFGRSGVAGRSRAATVGVPLAIAGTLRLLVGELASIPIRDATVSDSGTAIVGVVFGLASVLSAVGFLLTGWATLRAGIWRDWRRFTPLLTGVWLSALVFIAPFATKALHGGVGLYGACLLGMGIALYTHLQRDAELADLQLQRA
jgi:hypothetical protein